MQNCVRFGQGSAGNSGSSAYRTAARGGLAKSDNLRDLAMWAVALAFFLLGSVILIWYGLP